MPTAHKTLIRFLFIMWRSTVGYWVEEITLFSFIIVVLSYFQVFRRVAYFLKAASSCYYLSLSDPTCKWTRKKKSWYIQHLRLNISAFTSVERTIKNKYILSVARTVIIINLKIEQYLGVQKSRRRRGWVRKESAEGKPKGKERRAPRFLLTFS